MSIIKFCALGGLGENGKNMYVVTVDDKLFVLDAGLKYPSAELYGIDSVIPNIDFLEENRDKICGVFLSHGHEDNIGAILEVIKRTDAPIYTTNFTASIVELMMEEESLRFEKERIIRISEKDKLKFDNVTVTFFNTTHSIPESVGISINTADGSVVYAPDFALNPTNDVHYRTSFDKITDISKNKTLVLCPESLGVNNFNRVEHDYGFNYKIKELLQKKKRIIFSMFSSNLQGIQKVIDLCVAENRKIAIMGRKTQKTINVAMSMGYLKIPNKNLKNLKFMTPENSNDDDNLVIIIAGSRHEPYFMLLRMMTDQDRLVALRKEDIVCIIAPPVHGTEKIAGKTKESLYKLGCKVSIFGKEILRSSHANGEDLKLMYQLLSPKYIIPVVGEFRHQYQHRNIAIENGYKNSNIVMLDNGDQVTFIDGNLQEKREKVEVGDVLIDGSIIGDINEIVIKDRQYLSDNGAVVAVVNIDTNISKIVAGPKIISKGFIATNIWNEIVVELESITYNVVVKHLRKVEVDFNALKNDIRDKLAKEIEKTTNKRPVILPVVINMCEEDM